MPDINLTAEIKANSRLSSISRMRGKPQGFAIEDSVNGIAFSTIRPILDTSKPMYSTLMREFNAKYGKVLEVFPYHFVVEMGSDGEYMIYNTRPVSQKFPANLEWYKMRIKEDAVLVNNETLLFLKNRQDKDIQELIHILILGDTTIDVYPRDIYRKIGAYIIAPLARMAMIPPISNIFPLNIGHKFNINALIAASNSGG